MENNNQGCVETHHFAFYKAALSGTSPGVALLNSRDAERESEFTF